MGAEDGFPHFFFVFSPISAALFIVEVFEKLSLSASPIFLVSFF